MARRAASTPRGRAGPPPGQPDPLWGGARGGRGRLPTETGYKKNGIEAAIGEIPPFRLSTVLTTLLKGIVLANAHGGITWLQMST